MDRIDGDRDHSDLSQTKGQMAGPHVEVYKIMLDSKLNSERLHLMVSLAVSMTSSDTMLPRASTDDMPPPRWPREAVFLMMLSRDLDEQYILVCLLELPKYCVLICGSEQG